MSNDLFEIKYKSAVYEKFKFFETALKDYNLIDKDSKSFERNLLDFSHLNLEIGDSKYSERVSLWFDFITTMCVTFKVEPIILTENGGIPNLKSIVPTLFGFNNEKCCGEDFCLDCFGFGFVIPDVEYV